MTILKLYLQSPAQAGNPRTSSGHGFTAATTAMSCAGMPATSTLRPLAKSDMYRTYKQAPAHSRPPARSAQRHIRYCQS